MRLRTIRVASALYLVPVGLALLAGCGADAEKLYDVSGTATYDGGKPIPAGQVYFDPDPTKGGSGMQGVAAIKDGRYDTAEPGGRGVRGGGGYVIRVSGFDGKPANEAPQGKVLFNQYSMSKDLPKEKSELNIDVPTKR